MSRWPRWNTRSRYAWPNHTQVRKPVPSLSSADSGTRGRLRGGGLIARIVPETVVTSLGLRLRRGVSWLRSSWRVGR